MRRRRFRHEKEEPVLPARSPVEDAVPTFRDPPAKHLFQDDAASQRFPQREFRFIGKREFVVFFGSCNLGIRIDPR